MQKRYWCNKCILSLLFIVLLSLSACGSLSFFATGSAPTPTPHVQKYVPADLDSCSLVTATQIEQIIKSPVTVQEPDRINGHIDLNLCRYNLQSEGTVGVGLYTGKDSASEKNYFTTLINHDSAMKPKPIKNLGDLAYVEQVPFSNVYVLKDNAVLYVSIAIMMNDTTRENQEIQIARIALHSL